VACYQTFLRGLLDITDNLVSGKLVPPPDVVRLDDNDPYLVVAADKGTATFSDYANAISAEYGFWLDDAFASGGSVGYDHKKMGITARGAWESVKRHFREMGIDIQTTIHRGRRGRHVGRRVRQRHAAVARIRLRGRVRPSPYLPRPDPDCAKSLAERSACSICRARAGPTTTPR
jgi:glutamate dehydrogenase